VRELAAAGARDLAHDEHLWERELKGFTGTVFHWRARNSG
jgi:hypothetical protein